MNNRAGLVILVLLLIVAIIFGIIQIQNLNQSRIQISDLQKTVTAQAVNLVNQATSGAATLNAAVMLGDEKVVIAKTDVQQIAFTQQAQTIATQQSQVTATLAAIIAGNATTQANQIRQAATSKANFAADSQATLSVITTQLAEANAQMATLEFTPQATSTPQPNSQNSSSNIQLGTLVTTEGLDRNGCATQPKSIFAPDEDIYVVAPNSKVPSGTTVFVRLYREDVPIEDAPELTADRDYTDICINYVFQPTGADFVTGNYTAQFFINGKAGPSIDLKVNK